MSKFIFAVILLFINIDGLSSNILIKIIPVLLISIVLFEEIVNNQLKVAFLKKGGVVFFLFFIMIVIGVCFSNKPDMSINYKFFRVLKFVLLIITFIMVVVNRSYKVSSPLELFIKCVYLPFMFFLGLNLILFMLNLSDNDYSIGNSVMLSYLGISMPRIQFILSPGINAYGSLLGVLFTMSLVGFFVVKNFKKYFLVGIIISFISLLLTDSRGPVVYSIIITILLKFYYNGKSKPRFLWVIPFIGFFGPALLLYSLTLLADTEYASLISRKSGDLATGNSRAFIWLAALSELLVFKPEFHIFGYGGYGHFKSGVSNIYGAVFGNLVDANLMHPHNTYISLVLDYGYSGLLLFLTIQLLVLNYVKKMWAKNNKVALLILANLLYYNLVGIGETMFGFYYHNILYVFCMINIFAFLNVILYYKKNREKV